MNFEKVTQVISSPEFQSVETRRLITDLCEEITHCSTTFHCSDAAIANMIRIGCELVNTYIEVGKKFNVKTPSVHTQQGLYFELLQSYEEPWMQFFEVSDSGHMMRCDSPLIFDGNHRYFWEGLSRTDFKN